MRIVAVTDDLLFGSNILGALRAAGHEAALCPPEPEALRERAAGADVMIVDLTSDAQRRAGLLQAWGSEDGGRPRALAFYAHVEADTRVLAQRAGFDLVVPRSRIAREGVALVERLAGGPDGA
jgi:DNA-binding response OmpR family regulator